MLVMSITSVGAGDRMPLIFKMVRGAFGKGCARALTSDGSRQEGGQADG
jgi:hypothetical protein